MRRLWVVLVLLALLLLACVLVPTPPATVPPPTPWAAGATPTSTPTGTATSPATSTPLPTPTSTPVPTSTPTPSATAPAVELPVAPYAVQEEQAVGGYVVRLWRNTSDQGYGFDDVATLSRGEHLLVRVEQVVELGPETGADLTGEGHPDVVFHIYTGGAHCCFSTIVYDLGETPRKVLETPLSNCGSAFEDLDGDGVPEVVTCDDLFAYVYCAFAGSPAVRVVLRYDPAQGYVPASPDFADTYAGIVAQHRELAANARAGEMGEWDQTAKCSVLPLLLDYLYTGRPGDAAEALDAFYDRPDANLFWTEVVQAIERSPLYAPGTAQIDVSAPPYYMLQLLTGCGAGQQGIGLLTEGQEACALAVPYRDVSWLDGHLRHVGLLSEGEMISLGPEGCTADCRLDVVRTSDGARLGSIRLDTTAGYPGEVYRVDGTESAHWRLRGDLTWEQAPR